jgi:hypothetical protein
MNEKKEVFLSTFSILANYFVGLCHNTYLLSYLMLAITTYINHPHPPWINLRKEVQPIHLTTLSKKWLRYQLNDPFQNPKIPSSMHAWMR